MGRRTHSRSLALWANGEHVGRWTITARGAMELQYDPAWRASPRGRPLSLALPFGINGAALTGPAVASYFEGLLPDSDAIRRRVAARFRTGSTEAFDLLAAVGRDCVGAVQLLREGEHPARGGMEGVRVDAEAIERHLLAVVAPDRFGGQDPDDDFRISLAGAQEKDAFLCWQGQWMKPRGATPTSHIFKLPLGLVGGRRADFSTSVDNEWLCLRLLRAYGLPVAEAEIATFGTQRVLVVERFDRSWSADGRQLYRRVQEDFCQALGVPPLLKYESDGGPGWMDLCALARQSVHAEQDLRTLMAAQILFWLLRAPDGHAKNFSLRIQPGAAGRFHLAPLYDVMSALPIIGHGPNQWAWREVRLAMAVLGKNRHALMYTVQRRHFNSTARKVGYGDTAEPLIEALLARTPAAIAEAQAALPPGFSQHVADTVLGGLQQAARDLERMPAH